MLWLERKKNLDQSKLKTGHYVLDYDKIVLLFNAGPFAEGGDCLFIEADGKPKIINSNILLLALEAYEIHNQ